MELAEALLQVNWSSSSATAPSEESHMMAQLLSTCFITGEPSYDTSLGVLPPLSWSDHGVDPSYSSYSWPRDCNNGGLLPPASMEYYALCHSNMIAEAYTSSAHMGFCALEEQASPTPLPVARLQVATITEEAKNEDFADSTSANLVEPAFLSSLNSSPKRKTHDVHGQDAGSTAIPTKKPRALQKNGKNEQLKKIQNGSGSGTESNGGPNGQDSSSCSSEEDPTSSQEVDGGGRSSGSRSSTASDLNGKARAGRGAATDPQSLYARRRRERINERLKTLQNLVPNGTKVDISTMLEEAVQYVKFLQLQIKLLNSDDLWMYAPLYNGMDIGRALKNT